MAMARRLALVLLIAALAGLAGIAWWRSHNAGPAQRGARLAAERGCLSCHGPAGHMADPDGALGIGSVPSFGHDDVTGYAKSEGEIREWILDGKPRRLREAPADEPEPLLAMPAWRGRLSAAEVDQLVAYVKAVSDFDPAPEAVAAGRDAAARLGCFACHGPQGRFDTPNPGSLKGYIPSWSGADFPELAKDDGEIREWIRDGSPRRLRDNPAASFFLGRQAIRMPAYRDRASEDEVRQITAYIGWLRGTPAR
jgi:mono/diheme cytochrome c family protein